MKPINRLLALAVGLAVAFCALAQAAPTVTISVSPVSGISPAGTTVTWSSTGAATCTKSGAWTGSAPPSGSLLFPGLLSTSVFTLVCTEGSSSGLLSWTPPVLNTDGTPLTDLAGYKIYQSTSSAALPTSTSPGTVTPVVISTPTTTSYTATGLLSGTYFWNLRSTNAAGIDSDPTGIVSKVVSLQSATASATFTVNKKPGPPTNTTVASNVYDLKNGKPNYYVGDIALGVECGAYVGRKWGVDFYAVDPSKVEFFVSPAPKRVAAQCSAS